jgi:hypothetical protein
VKFDQANKSAKLVIGVHNSAIGFFLESNSEIILERIFLDGNTKTRDDGRGISDWSEI